LPSGACLIKQRERQAMCESLEAPGRKYTQNNRAANESILKEVADNNWKN
jgi:hypothetical protein